MAEFGQREYELLKQCHKYLQKYGHIPIVTKIGGNAMKDPEARTKMFGEFSFLSSMGFKLVIVHGGAPEINDLLGKLGTESKFIDGKRVTDEQTLEGTEMALHNLNKSLVKLINKHRGKATGISGLDGNLFQAKQTSNPEYGKVGDIVKVNPEIIQSLLEGGFLPIIDPISANIDSKGEALNVNGDDAAMALAEAIGGKLVLMTETNGVRRDKDDPNSVIPIIDIAKGGVEELIQQGIVTDGMIPKIKACANAIKKGAYSVSIIEGTPLKLTEELVTDKGTGTEFINSAKEQKKHTINVRPQSTKAASARIFKFVGTEKPGDNPADKQEEAIDDAEML
jgi:acetylglutamate kinase